MRKFTLAVVGAIAAAATATAVAVGAPTITDVSPSGPAGQASCTQFGGVAEIARFAQSDVTTGKTINGVTITSATSSDADSIPNLFSFSSTVPIQYVLVHAGSTFTLYNYGSTSNVLSGSDLSASTGQNISQIVFCSGSGVLPAQLRSLTASASARSVNVRWQTASEIGVAGYNVYGVVNGHRAKLNARIIASKGSNSRYSFSYSVPRGKKAPSRILLQVVNLDGSRQWRSARVAS